MYLKLSITTLIIFILSLLASASKLPPMWSDVSAREESGEKVVCSPSNVSPLLADALEAVKLLWASPYSECYNNYKWPQAAACKELQCFKSACIGRCTLGKWDHLSTVFTCKAVADYAAMILRDPSCLTADKQKIGGKVTATTPATSSTYAGTYHKNDINIYASKAWANVGNLGK